MSYSKIRTEPFLDNSALRVVLNAPKGNVLDSVMMGEINALLDELKPRHDLRLICFTGEGSHFSFGASVEEHVGDKARAMLTVFHGMFRRLVELAVPTVAAVRGRCLGGGLELAAFCNWVVAHPEAVFAQPEIQLAVLPPVASLILPLKIGQAAADDINITGRNVSANEALALHLVDRLADDPLADVETWAAREIAPKSASSLRFALRASRWQFNQTMRSQMDAVEKFYLDELMQTHDANEGLAAFLEKRKPAWQHR
ncbi:MAG: enoyl-CoA hydratase/isomerase family protein [Deltaproteobacteria bacterium]|nr:enoyl-CoA hydratase/isomerase family protein [Deltaproteobacteria bacterium]